MCHGSVLQEPNCIWTYSASRVKDEGHSEQYEGFGYDVC